jgi:hypothetical protein
MSSADSPSSQYRALSRPSPWRRSTNRNIPCSRLNAAPGVSMQAWLSTWRSGWQFRVCCALTGCKMPTRVPYSPYVSGALTQKHDRAEITVQVSRWAVVPETCLFTMLHQLPGLLITATTHLTAGSFRRGPRKTGITKLDVIRAHSESSAMAYREAPREHGRVYGIVVDTSRGLGQRPGPISAPSRCVVPSSQ